MATIDSKKLLPPSKSSLSLKNKKILIPVSNVRVKKNVKSTSEDLKKDSSSGISSDSILGIKNIISKIKDVVLKGSIFQKKEQDNKRKDREKEARKKRELKLEKKPTNKNVTSGIASLPNLSFIDRIKKFLFWTILGRLFSDLFPKLIEFSKRILPVVDFIENFAGNVLKGVVDFIDWGYNAYDKVRDLTKQIGGENAQKVFDDFSKHFNTVLNLALIAAMAGSSIDRGGDGPDRGKPGKPGQYGGSGGGKPTAADRTRNARIRNIQKQYGPNARKIYENALNNGKTPQQAEAAIKRGFKKGVSIRPGAESLAAKTAKSGSIFKRGLGKIPTRLATKALGRAGVKVAGKALGRIPIIGGLVDFLFALWSGEKPGRAAAKAVGATIGSALGTFIPIPIAGTILGGILGDIVGGALYDTLVSNNSKVQKKASGGKVTRANQNVGGSPTRKLKVSKIKKPAAISIPKTQPGKDIGGEKRIRKFYAKPQDPSKRYVRPPGGWLSILNIFGGNQTPQSGQTTQPGKVDETAYMTLINMSKSLKGESNSLAKGILGLVSSGVDMTLGQKPDQKLFESFFKSIGYVADTLAQQRMKTNINSLIRGFAEGGSIPSREFKSSFVSNTGELLSKLIGPTIDQRIEEAMQKIEKELLLKGGSSSGGGGGGGNDGGADGPDVFHGMGAERMWNFFKNKGLSDFAVAGIMGNARWESSFNPTARGKGMGPGGSDALGIFQWGETERWKDLVNWAKSKNLNPWDYDTQLKFAWHEMQTTEKATIPAIQGATSAADAAEKFRAVYERSAHTEKRRKDAAEGFYKQYKGKTYIPPTTGVPLTETSQFGWRWGRQHSGIDLQAKSGWRDTIHLPVVVKQGGTVKYAGITDGNFGIVEIDHPDGSRTRYVHLNGFKVKTGETVKPGQIIGRLAGEGESGYGNSTGPHLHFEYYPPGKGAIDPKNIYSKYVSLGAIKTQPAANPLASNPGASPQPSNKPGSSKFKNNGVTFKGGQFVKLGGGWLGSNETLRVNDIENTQYRQLPEFGLGRGTKVGEIKQAKDKNYYKWTGSKWVSYDPVGGGNASLSTKPLSQEVASIGNYTSDSVTAIQNVVYFVEVPA